LLVTALLIAPLAALLKGYPVTQAFTGDPSALRYIWANATLLITQYDIASILATNPTPDIFDGSLWTLIFEAFCYLLIGALGVTGLLRLRPVLVPIVAAIVWLLSIGHERGINVGLGDDLMRMVFLFFVGATAHLYGHRIPMKAWLAAGAVIVFVISAATLENYRPLGAVPLAYALLWFSACFRWSLTLRADLSYGIYIYHWPILQLMASTALVRLPSAGFVLIGLLLTTAVGAASWFLIEKPALACKHNAVPNQVEGAVRRALAHLRRRVNIG
jgi:peptidoglycan/LPS O-acetylase OafA/YrhL